MSLESRRKKSLLILIEPHGATRTFQRRISYVALGWIVGAVALMILAAAAAIFVAARASRMARNSVALHAENDSLKMEFGRLAQIEAEVEELRETNNQLLRLAGVVPVDSTMPAKVYADTGKVPDDWMLSRPSTAPRVGVLSRGFDRGDQKAGHTGVDVPGPEGSLIVSAGGGIVVSSGQTDVFGNELLIDHGDGIQTFYGHNREVLVVPGDSVSAGQPVARLGNTGQSSAPHLHFEVRVDGAPVDPGEFIREYRVSP